VSWTVFNGHGQRKYLTSKEVDSFVLYAATQPIEVRTFCNMLAFSGCRISEALSLTRESIDFQARNVTFRCLKKRGQIIYRAVPLPPHFLRLLGRWFGKMRGNSGPLWPWSRMTGYRRVTEIMREAGIEGSYATPKGLRHAFGVRAIQAGVPLTLVQKWLGHADIKTTAIYTNAMGPEEQEIAARMWSPGPRASAPPRAPLPAATEGIAYIGAEVTPVVPAVATIARLPVVASSPAPCSAPNRSENPQKTLQEKTQLQINRLHPCSLLQFWI
jgi:hypothetical protein